MAKTNKKWVERNWRSALALDRSHTFIGKVAAAVRERSSCKHLDEDEDVVRAYERRQLHYQKETEAARTTCASPLSSIYSVRNSNKTHPLLVSSVWLQGIFILPTSLSNDFDAIIVQYMGTKPPPPPPNSLIYGQSKLPFCYLFLEAAEGPYF